jgi:hypothetical protein
MNNLDNGYSRAYETRVAIVGSITEKLVADLCASGTVIKVGRVTYLIG